MADRPAKQIWRVAAMVAGGCLLILIALGVYIGGEDIGAGGLIVLIALPPLIGFPISVTVAVIALIIDLAQMRNRRNAEIVRGFEVLSKPPRDGDKPSE